MSSSAGGTSRRIAIWLPIVPLGTNIAAGSPKRSATSSSSRETVGDLAGWWFGRALELGRRLGGAAGPTEEVPTSVLSGTSGEAQVRAALARLPAQERAAVMLRDGYDLPPEAVAVALGRSIDD